MAAKFSTGRLITGVLIGYLLLQLSRALIQLIPGFGLVPLVLMAVAAAAGQVLIFVCFIMLRSRFVDEAWRSGFFLLILGALPGLIGAVFTILPMVRGFNVIGVLLTLGASIISLIGFLRLNRSEVLGDPGQLGTGLLAIAAALGAAGSLASLLPFLLGPIFSSADFVSLVLIIFGWARVKADFPETQNPW
jgi:hypothetical protein